MIAEEYQAHKAGKKVFN